MCDELGLLFHSWNILRHRAAGFNRPFGQTEMIPVRQKAHCDESPQYSDWFVPSTFSLA
jgi:hypothetical protein